MAALAERERRLVEAQERQNTLAETLQEALERQTVTSEVLRVISQSRSDARPVFESIVCAAARLLRCDMAFVLLRDGDAYIHTAGATPEGPLADLAPDRMPIDPDANFPSRAFLTKSELHLSDWSQIDLPEHECRIHERFGVNSALYLPLLRDDECIGLLALAGSRPDMFGPSQIAQAGSFRDQALIAIENSRQFNETQEALQQQKASAEVLGAISKSVADTTPVFETILDACRRLLGSDETGIYAIGDDNMVRVAAWRGPRAEEVRHDVTPLADSVTGGIIRERRVHHIPDLRAEPNLSPAVRDRVDRLGSASLLYAPMLWGDRGLGSILVVRSPPRPFSEREHALLQSFADQAAIAIQNARLFRETQEALQQQTATADVLKVISRSAFDLKTVLQTLIRSAVELSGSLNGVICLRRGDLFYFEETFGMSPEMIDFLRERPQAPGRDSMAARVALSRRVETVRDVLADSEYDFPVNALNRTRSLLGVPLLRNDNVEGVFVLSRPEPGEFSPRLIELVRTFADQAVIAIENLRLFDEVQARTRDLTEALQQQTATSEVLESHQPLGVRSESRPRRRFWRLRPGSAGRRSRRFICGTVRFAGSSPNSVCPRRSSAGLARRPSRFAIPCTRAGPRARAKSHISRTPGPIPTISTRRQPDWPAIGRSS